MYQLTASANIIRRLDDGAFISLPASESVGFAYEAWLAAGNTPLPANAPPFVWPHLSPRQVRLQLLADGKLSQVQTVINTLTDPQKSQAQIAWDYASEFLHDDPFLAALSPALGYDTTAKVQAFFEAAAIL